MMRLAAAIAFAALAAAAGTPQTVTVRRADTGAILSNPGMGLVMYHYDDKPSRYGECLEPGDSCEWFPGCGTVYLRIDWSYVEPEEGVFNWPALDTVVQRWAERGGQAGFRIMTSSGKLHRYATPEWVFRAGARGVSYDEGWGAQGRLRPDGKGNSFDPVFDDPVYLEKLDAFLKAFAAKYDGRPEVAFVDVGTFGLWGEGHLGASQKLPLAEQVRLARIHIDLHRRHFRRTPVLVNDDMAGHTLDAPDAPLMKYARSVGCGFRDDSVFCSKPPIHWRHDAWARLFAPSAPVFVETGHYDSCMRLGWWRGDLLERCVEDYRASWLSVHGDPRAMLAANSNEFARAALRIGYRLQLKELKYPRGVTVGTNGRARPFSFAWSWANAGVAPPYADLYPSLTVKDGEGRIMAVFTDTSLNLRTLETAPPGLAPEKTSTPTFTFGLHTAPRIRLGDYDIYVSAGAADGTPLVALPLPEGDGRNRYRFGKMRFE